MYYSFGTNEKVCLGGNGHLLPCKTSGCSICLSRCYVISVIRLETDFAGCPSRGKQLSHKSQGIGLLSHGYLPMGTAF